jgi:hypothetical protein
MAIPQADIDGRKIDTTDRVQVAANLLKKLVASEL